MSKSILIIDTPENCDDCQLMDSYYDHDYGWIKKCIGSEVNDCSVFGRKLEDYCPLKHLPEYVRDKNTFAIENKYMNYQAGYNCCLDKIL